MTPLVTIIVPVFNGDRFLKESLDSILNQTYPRIEVIVMDDASTDSTPEIVSSYANRVKYYRQSHNRGIYANANDGIAMAAGEYIATYHADDVYDAKIVEREVAFLERYPEAGAVFCPSIFIDPQGRERGRLNIPPEVHGERPLPYPVVFNALLKYKNVFLTCPSAMVRASVYKDVGVYRDAQFRNTSDLEMWLRIARNYPLGVLEDCLFRYRYGHGNSAQRYRRLRTDPERFFTIMDLYLAEGDSALATPEALSGHEAHRAEDNLMRTINSYILGEAGQAQAILRHVQAAKILGSPAVQRMRLLILYGALQCLVRLPRINFIADIFYSRWNVRGEWDKKQSVAARSKTGSAPSGI
jgi:glycosyltransferase involved in cell wall biosynthesis